MVRKVAPAWQPVWAATRLKLENRSRRLLVLGVDRAGALWGGNGQWGRKELGAVVLDLFEHLLQRGRGGIIGTCLNFLCKGSNFSLESFHRYRFAFMIESLVSVHRGQVQSLAQLVEQLALGF